MRGKIYKAAFILGLVLLLFYVAFGKDDFSEEKVKEIQESSIFSINEKELEESETEEIERILSIIQEPTTNESENGVFETETHAAEETEIQEPVSMKDSVINESQCLWGTWRLTQKFWGGTGFRDCENGDEMKNLEAIFLPDKMIFGDIAVEISYYSSRLAAVYRGDDKEIKHSAGYPGGDAELCGIMGNYVLEVDANFVDSPEIAAIGYPDTLFTRVALISDEEMILRAGNARYKAVKIQDCEVEEDAGFKVWESVAEFAQGSWKITEAIGSRDDSEIDDGKIGKFVEVSIPYSGSDFLCRGYSLNDDRVRELAEWLDIFDESSLMVSYELRGNVEWDEMIIKDKIHAFFVKGNVFYLAERVSSETPIYYQTF